MPVITDGAQVELVLGTMTIGPAIGSAHMDGTHTEMPSYCQTPPEVAEAQLHAMIACSHARATSGPDKGKLMLDTASQYQNWATEETLGRIFASHPELRREFAIHTKVNKGQKLNKALTRESVLYQAHGSLARLRVETIDVLYLHGPGMMLTPCTERLGRARPAPRCAHAERYGVLASRLVAQTSAPTLRRRSAPWTRCTGRGRSVSGACPTSLRGLW